MNMEEGSNDPARLSAGFDDSKMLKYKDLFYTYTFLIRKLFFIFYGDILSIFLGLFCQPMA